ncbi:MAG: Twin-arginine translocation pathway signal [Polaromonas sp.]|nr:Twin-arginine translocation pathway signal [Polaromonas sp.]
MNSLKRRSLLGGTGAVALVGLALPAFAQKSVQPAPVVRSKSIFLARKLRIVIPANAGGGWDQTGRALGAALVGAGAAEEIEYENKGGKGGTIGLVHYAEKYSNDPNVLLIGGTVMVGAVALHKPAVDMTAIRPVARLTSDYLVVVVAANSPIRNINDLAERIRSNQKEAQIAGGSAGGVDHVFSGMITRGARSKPEELVYVPFAGGAEVVQAVLAEKVVAGVSGYSEFSEHLATGKLRAIGVSSKRSIFGIPSIREQGMDVDIANWRGVFSGQGVSNARLATMVDAVKAATGHESWQKTLKDNRWEASWLSGPSLSNFIDFDLTTSRLMVHLLKFKA